jgi:prepilin-type N-terminal cleavage/methylation domain-containing protein
MGGIDGNQSGFTLIEMIIVIAIVGIIAGGIAAVVFQVFDVNGRSVVHMTAVKEVEDAAHWIIAMPRWHKCERNSTRRFPAYAGMVEWDNTSNDVTYSVQDGELRRSHSINDEPPTVTTSSGISTLIRK